MIPVIPLPHGIPVALRADLAGAPERLETLAEALCWGEPRDDRLKCLGIDLRTYRFGAREVDLHGLRPSQARWVGCPVTEMVEAVTLEVSAGLGRVLSTTTDLVRELLINAVGHRSYDAALLDVPIEVHRFTDGVRVVSPGGLPDGVETDGTCTRGRFSRNLDLMEHLVRLGLARQQGRGVAFVAMNAKSAAFRVSVEANARQVVTSLSLRPDVLVAPADARRQRLPEEVREDKIRAVLRRRNEVSASEIALETGMPNSTVRATLRRLIDRGVVEPLVEAPRSPHQLYSLTSFEEED